MKTLTILLMATLAAGAIAQPAQESGGKENTGSIYGSTAPNPFSDQIARGKGDIVLIEIDERSVATFAASTNSAKSDSTAVNPNVLTGFLTQLFGPLSNSASSTVSGQGDTSQNSRMSATMSAVVKDVLPNGTMIIEGSRSLVTNKETQTFVLSGMIRGVDITPRNTIPSSKIAEAEIRMEGKGQIQERQRKGILTTILDWLF